MLTGVMPRREIEWCVCLVIVTLRRVALMGVFQIQSMRLDKPEEKWVKSLMSGESAALL